MTPGDERSGRDTEQPMEYQIRLKGHLTSHWKGWFDGLTITLEEDGNTILSGPVVDQPALYGLLKKIRDLGLPLLSVNSVDLSQAITADTDPGEGDA